MRGHTRDSRVPGYQPSTDAAADDDAEDRARLVRLFERAAPEKLLKMLTSAEEIINSAVNTYLRGYEVRAHRLVL